MTAVASAHAAAAAKPKKESIVVTERNWAIFGAGGAVGGTVRRLDGVGCVGKQPARSAEAGGFDNHCRSPTQYSESGTRTSTRARSAVYMRGITSWSRAINAESCCAGGTLVRWHSPRIWVGWQPSVHVGAGMLAQRRARTAHFSRGAVVGLWVW